MPVSKGDIDPLSKRENFGSRHSYKEFCNKRANLTKDWEEQVKEQRPKNREMMEERANDDPATIQARKETYQKKREREEAREQ